LEQALRHLSPELIRGYCIDAFEGQAYGWKADIVININRSSKSVIEGSVAREPNLDSRNKQAANLSTLPEVI
jgi:hypothetical protein